MFIEQSINTFNPFWKYISGSLIIICFSFLGQIPLTLAVLQKSTTNPEIALDSDQAILQLFSPNVTLILVLLSFVFAIIGIYFVIKYLHKSTFTSLITTQKKVNIQKVTFSFTLWALISILSFAITYALNPADYYYNFEAVPFLFLMLIGLILIPIQTTCEELIFRGYLMQGFGNLARNKWFPLLMTSTIFGLLHIYNPEVSKLGYSIMIYYIGTGLFLGIITLLDDSLELAIGFHAANNLIGALLVTSEWSAFQTNSIFIDKSNPEAGLDIILPLVIIYPIVFYIFSKKYKWNNWQQKLFGSINL